MYGWTGTSPAEFVERMKLAVIRFRALKKEHKIDAIAFCGSSGCAVAFAIASKCKIPLIYVRKEGEKSHSNSIVECNDKSAIVKKYLIVDDFVDSGSTVEYIINSISKFAASKNAFPAFSVGVLCFDDYQDRDREIWTPWGPKTCFTVDKPLDEKLKKAVSEFTDELAQYKTGWPTVDCI